MVYGDIFLPCCDIVIQKISYHGITSGLRPFVAVIYKHMFSTEVLAV